MFGVICSPRRFLGWFYHCPIWKAILLFGFYCLDSQKEQNGTISLPQTSLFGSWVVREQLQKVRLQFRECEYGQKGLGQDLVVQGCRSLPWGAVSGIAEKGSAALESHRVWRLSTAANLFQTKNTWHFGKGHTRAARTQFQP